jgi:hypothetical protein
MSKISAELTFFGKMLFTRVMKNVIENFKKKDSYENLIRNRLSSILVKRQPR